MRLVWVFLMLAGVFLASFLVWGEGLEEMFTHEGAVSWLERFGGWAWVAGLGLLVSDVFLPIPGTAVMAGLGLVYGAFWGGVISAAGSCLSGLVAYGLCRILGERMAVRLLGAKDLARGHRLFARRGGWLVALSRWLPLLPEVISCMAGLARMPFRAFLWAMMCGSVPLGFTFAAVGHAGVDHPALALGLSAALPPLLWLGVQSWLNGAGYWAPEQAATNGGAGNGQEG